MKTQPNLRQNLEKIRLTGFKYSIFEEDSLQ